MTDDTWSEVPLREVLSRVQRAEVPLPGGVYRQLGVRLWGQGAYEREPLNGGATKYAALYRVEAGDVVVNKIWARNGSVAVVPSGLEGCYVSAEFPTFAALPQALHPRWFHWLTRTATFWAQCDEKSRGTSGKNRIRPERFLEIPIPLPPLDEQRRIVARIEELAAKIEEARALRGQAADEAEAMWAAGVNDLWRDQGGWTRQPIRELATIVAGLVDPRIEPYASLPHINGEAIEARTCRLLRYRTAREDAVTSGKYHFHAGCVLYSKIRPYLQKSVLVPFDALCSADVYAFSSIQPVLEPRFFMYSLISPAFTEYANSLSGRTRMPKLNQKQLLAFELPYPGLAEQRRIAAHLDGLQAKVDALKRMQAETAAELDALIPTLLEKAFKGEL